MSLQTTGCGGECEGSLLPFAVSPTYDELWYLTSGSFDATLGRRKKIDGSGATPWAGLGGVQSVGGSNEATGVGTIRIMPQGDLVISTGISNVGLGGGYSRVARYARPQ